MHVVNCLSYSTAYVDSKHSLTKVTIRPGQSRFLTTYPGKKSQFSWDAHLSRFGMVPWICPDLPISAAVCLRIGGQLLAQILSVYTKNTGGRGSTSDPGSSQCSPRPPSQTPYGARTL